MKAQLLKPIQFHYEINSMNFIFKNNSGQALVIITALIVIFLATSVAIINYLTSNSRAARRLNELTQAVYLAEAGIEKAIFCLNHDVDADCGGTAGINYTGESSVALNIGDFTTTVVVNGDDRIITSTGQTNSGIEKIIRVIATAAPETTDISFIFGSQIGEGGLLMGANSLIEGVGGTFGNVHSDGNITCGANAAISGTAQVSGNGNKIDGCDIGYDGDGNLVNDLADAHAHTLRNCRVAHDVYHPTSGTLSACSYGLGSLGGTLYDNSPLPDPIPFPITSQMIQDWETEAAAGNGGVPIIGPYTTTDGETLGPVKIQGDLTVANGNTVFLGGVLWVEGDITIENLSSFSLLPSFGPNSSIVIADDPANQATKGILDIDNNAIIDGSGEPDSYIILISTNSGSSAIDIKNNSNGAIYFAQNGTTRINNRAKAKEVVSYKVVLGNNAVLQYETGLQDANFATGPGGKWRIKRETWQVID
jgi:hypothetical protein